MFFIFREKEDSSPEIKKKQDDFLKKLIQSRYCDPNCMTFIFSVVSYFSPERRLQFVATFLEHNKCFEVFRGLNLEPNSWGWSGSAVPLHQKRLDFFKSLIPKLNTVDFLQHRQYIEDLIQNTRLQIEDENRRDFIGESILLNP